MKQNRGIINIKQKENEITVRRKKDYIIDSQYGNITYKQWCIFEVKRIGNCRVIEEGNLCWVEKI
jgi:hypothetical protein